MPPHVMPHTDGAVIVKNIWSRHFTFCFCPSKNNVTSGRQPELFLLPKISTLSTTPHMSSLSTMLTMSINANTVLTLCNVGALCNNSLLRVPAQVKHRKNCECCPTEVTWKFKFKCWLCPSCLSLLLGHWYEIPWHFTM